MLTIKTSDATMRRFRRSWRGDGDQALLSQMGHIQSDPIYPRVSYCSYYHVEEDSYVVRILYI